MIQKYKVTSGTLLSIWRASEGLGSESKVAVVMRTMMRGPHGDFLNERQGPQEVNEDNVPGSRSSKRARPGAAPRRRLHRTTARDAARAADRAPRRRVS